MTGPLDYIDHLTAIFHIHMYEHLVKHFLASCLILLVTY